MAKKQSNRRGIVYSTDPDFNLREDESEPEQDFIPKEKQQVRILLDKKQRSGKVVTLVYGLDNTGYEIDELGKELRKFCGTGGSSKNGEILIQGDFRNKVLQWFIKNGYRNTKIV